MSLTIEHVEQHFQRAREGKAPPAHIYAEVGRYKPFSMPTIQAAMRRGYRVVKLARSVYEIHEKAQAAGRVE